MNSQEEPKVIISKTKKKLLVKRKKKHTTKETLVSESVSVSISETDYINSMRDNEKDVYRIAIDHLESSFNLEKSNGYQEYLKGNLKRNM